MSIDPQQRIFAAISECLNSWTNVEVEISHLFMVLQERPWNDFSHPLRVAFEAVISLETRLAMIAASVSVDVRYKDRYAEHFNALQNKILKSYKKRHEVAHFLFVNSVDEQGTTFSIAPFFSWHTFKQQTGKPLLNAAKIEERARSFNGLRLRVNQHTQHIGRLRGLPLEYFVQAGDLVHPPLF